MALSTDVPLDDGAYAFGPEGRHPNAILRRHLENETTLSQLFPTKVKGCRVFLHRLRIIQGPML
jgi:hypothetical protein